MSKIVHVLILEDDPYARSWMELLCRRDWRTQVVDEAGGPAELARGLAKARAEGRPLDLVLLDSEIPGRPGQLEESLDLLARQAPEAGVLFTSVVPDERVRALAGRPTFRGYLLKDEIRYALAWAAALTEGRPLVLTPGARDFLLPALGRLPAGALVLDGRRTITPLNERQADLARLVILFSMERHELADELNYNRDYPYGLASELYKHLGMDELLGGEVDPTHYLGDHPAVLAHFREILQDRKLDQKKHKDKETLAFHLLTAPEIVEEVEG